MYYRYFSLQATRPLGLVDTIRSSIEENICLTHLNGPGPDCFESALYVLFTAMEKVKRILNSKLHIVKLIVTHSLFCCLFFLLSMHFFSV